ncbi:MAG: hypothetical protein HQK67_10450, partial [Desulfamplus sp.]|nr:hypothetical protein [Desulfamplus sp.]
MKNNSYNLNKDVLTIKTAFGHYKFKIEDTDLLNNAERIVRLMISEIDNVDKKLSTRKEKSGQYARLLLTNLNLCEKYIQLEDKYIQLQDTYRGLTEKLETIDKKLESATTAPQISPQISSQISPEAGSELVQIEPALNISFESEPVLMSIESEVIEIASKTSSEIVSESESKTVSES